MSAIKEYNYQYEYSKIRPEPMFDRAMREQKAKKIIAVLRDFYQVDTSSLSCLDMSCSAGWITSYLKASFGSVIGMDIDKDAVIFGATNTKDRSVKFVVGDSMNVMLKDSSVDVAICTHMYEHVPDSERLIKEIYRVLKPGGVCFFAGPNKLWPIEPHHNLPGLSWLPKLVANYYVKMFRGQESYYENLVTYRQLKRLVSSFEMIDYTSKVLREPVKYMMTDMIRPNTFKAFIAVIISKVAPWLSPTFVCILRKKEIENGKS